jgi:hypothetical protein
MGWHGGWNWMLAVGFELRVTALDAHLPALLVKLIPVGRGLSDRRNPRSRRQYCLHLGSYLWDRVSPFTCKTKMALSPKWR